MKLSAMLEQMIAAGATSDVLLAAVKAFEEQHDDALERSREKGRERWKRWKNKQGTNVSQREQQVANGSNPLVRDHVRVEDNLLPKKISGKKENKKDTRASDEAAFREDLAPDLPSELLDGCIKVRREKRGQVSGLAARLFRDDAIACGMSVLDAAKTCVSRSWITVKPEYFNDRQHRGQGPPKKTTLASMWRDEGRKLGILDDPANPANRRLEAGLGRGQNQGDDPVRTITGSTG